MLEDIVDRIDRIKEEQMDIKLYLSKQDPFKEMTSRETAEYNSKMQRMSELKAELKSLEEEKKEYCKIFKNKRRR